MIEKDKYPVSAALFAVAGIQAVVGCLGWSMYAASFAPIDWVITFSFAIFAALAILARRARIPAAIIATALYGAFLAFQATISVQLVMTGLIFKIPNVILLLMALAFAFKSTKPTEQDPGVRTNDACV